MNRARVAAVAAYTLAEAMIAMCGSTIVIGALLYSCLNLQRCLHSAEQFASDQADQRRLLDYVARDLRRSIGVASTTSVGGVTGTPIQSGSVTVENGTSLLVTIPGYYQTQSPTAPNSDKPLSVVAADNYVDYGAAGVHAPGVSVIFRKQFEASQNCVCFVRFEGDSETVIVRDADNLHLIVTLAGNGRDCTVQSTFVSPYRDTASPLIREQEDVQLRNIRTD